MDLEWLNISAVRYLFEVWVFLLGGAIGSFLNVVVYRLPRGESLVFPPSHCPRCGHPIRWYDNVPILSWMILGGKCRDCRGAIAARYPLVEALCAAMFLVVVWRVGLGNCVPQRPEVAGEGVLVRRLTLVEGLGASAYQLVLLATLLAAGLIEYDGHPLPVRVALPALVIGAVVPLLWPQVRPVPAVALVPAVFGQAHGGLRLLSGAWMGAIDGLVGLGGGLAIGFSAWRLLGGRQRLGWLVGPACLGLYLGWQACAVISAGVVVLREGFYWIRGEGTGKVVWWDRVFPGLVFWLGGLGWILAWERLWGLFALGA